jgi:hypothetical protein
VICRARGDAELKAAGGGAALEKDVEILIAEAKRKHDPAIVRSADAALRAGDATKECGPSYADRIDVALLPETPRRTVENADLSGSLRGFRRGAIGYYTTHFGSGEDAAERECVTTSGGLFEDVEGLENFLYLLDVGNRQAKLLLAHLRHDCRAEGT